MYNQYYSTKIRTITCNRISLSYPSLYWVEMQQTMKNVQVVAIADKVAAIAFVATYGASSFLSWFFSLCSTSLHLLQLPLLVMKPFSTDKWDYGPQSRYQICSTLLINTSDRSLNKCKSSNMIRQLISDDIFKFWIFINRIPKDISDHNYEMIFDKQ